MIKTLVKKQMMEVFKGYFYNTKKNKARSKVGMVLMFFMFAVLMVGVLGGIFAGVSFWLMSEMAPAGLGWLGFLLMSFIALALGVFGSVFNTYAGLYKAKDNDMLFAMPIPVSAIIIARLLNVYLLGLMYSAIVIVPTSIIYFILGYFSIQSLLGGLALLLVISLFDLLLSCFLGWIIAKISGKIKNKSFVTVLVSLVFFGLYYLVCFKAQALLAKFLENMLLYGETIKGKMMILYTFGRIGEGHILSILIWLLVAAVLTGLVYRTLSRSFMKLATATDAVKRQVYKNETAKQRSMFGTLLAKEFGRFTSSATYMLNCGFGVLIVLIGAVVLLFKGPDIVVLLETVFGTDMTAAILISIACAAAGVNDITAPSVSLEGKNIWILQSLPINPVQVLLAKLSVQLILTEIPTLILTIVLSTLIDLTLAQTILLIVFPLLFGVLMALVGLVTGLLLPNLNWTNEVVPIKQSLAVIIALFGGWAIVALFAGLYIWKGYLLGMTSYFGVLLAIMALAVVGMLVWIVKKGGKIFSRL